MTARERLGRAIPDPDVPSGSQKTARIDLGLALLSRIALPGVTYTHDEIAAWCGCTNGAILMIERKALKKLRNRLFFMGDRRLIEAVEQMFYARQPAQRKVEA